MIDPTINPSYRGVTPALSTGGGRGIVFETLHPPRPGRRGNSLVKARAKPTQSEAIYTEQEPALE